MAEEEDWGQLGVLPYQQDERIEFGRRAERRRVVHIDTGRRYVAELLHHSRHVEKDYTVGDVVMVNGLLFLSTHDVLEGDDGWASRPPH